MSDGILGLGSDGSVDLSQDLIDQLKEAESTSILDPITTEMEDTQLQIDAVAEIDSKILELLAVVETFDLYTTDTNIFDEVSATTSGDSVSFTATDTSDISPGTINVTVNQLATKDAYQSNLITDTEAAMDEGTLSVTIGDETYDFDTTGQTYESLITTMNYNSSLDVALEQVSDDSYRLVIKSAQSGLDNAITISQSGSLDLGYDNEDNHVLTAQNFEGTIDGIDYNLSSNSLTMDNGLSIAALELGDSSISIVKDETAVVEQVEAMATAYNELVDLVDAYTTGDEEEAAVLSDSSTIRSIMSGIKEFFYDSYGLDDEENSFIHGISFDSDGYMDIDTSALSTSLQDNYNDVRELLVGYAEKEGIGTRLSTYLDSLDGTNGLLTTYEDNLADYLDELEDEYDEQSDSLDEKYELMTTQFAAYTVIITQMENEFASLEAIIDSDD